MLQNLEGNQNQLIILNYIGSQAGCNWDNTRIITGSIGVLEGRVEMELTLNSITKITFLTKFLEEHVNKKKIDSD